MIRTIILFIIFVAMVVLMIVGVVLILFQFKSQQKTRIMSGAEDDAIILLKRIRPKTADKENHISRVMLKDWTEGKLGVEFLDCQVAGEWKQHLAGCPECREMIEFCRGERNKKTIKELKN